MLRVGRGGRKQIGWAGGLGGHVCGRHARWTSTDTSSLLELRDDGKVKVEMASRIRTGQTVNLTYGGRVSQQVDSIYFPWSDTGFF